MNKLSVIIPCKNESAILKITLPGIIEELNQGRLHEVILVDNDSSDNSIAVAKSYPTIQVHACTGTISDVRNYGAARSSGDFLCFVDADVEVESGWSRMISDFIEKSGAEIDSIVFGNVYGIPKQPTWIERLWFQSLTSRKKPNYINGGNLIVSRTQFESLGGFDPAFVTGEDVDFCSRAKARSCTIVQLPDLHTIHHGYPKCLSAFYRREKWHGSGVLKDVRTPWKSKPLLMVGMLLLLPIVIPAMYLTMGTAATVGVLLLGWMGACFLVSRRCSRKLSLDTPRLVLLFMVYAIARTHAALDGLIAGKYAGRNYQGRDKTLGH